MVLMSDNMRDKRNESSLTFSITFDMELIKGTSKLQNCEIDKSPQFNSITRKCYCDVVGFGFKKKRGKFGYFPGALEDKFFFYFVCLHVLSACRIIGFLGSNAQNRKIRIKLKTLMQRDGNY